MNEPEKEQLKNVGKYLAVLSTLFQANQLVNTIHIFGLTVFCIFGPMLIFWSSGFLFIQSSGFRSSGFDLQTQLVGICSLFECSIFRLLPYILREARWHIATASASGSQDPQFKPQYRVKIYPISKDL